MQEISRSRVSVRIAQSQEDLLWAMMIRAAVYVGEDGCAITDEADGNDFGATHVIGTVDGRPVGTIRIRYFGGFAVLERMAVLKEFRAKRFGSRGVAWEIGEFAFQFCRLKGYTRFYGHARDGLVDFWRKFAPPGATFEPIEGAEVSYRGMTGYPMSGRAPMLNGAIGDVDSITGAEHMLVRSREASLPGALRSGWDGASPLR